MDYVISEENPIVIRVKTSDPINVDDVTNMVTDILTVVSRTQCYNVFIDYRDSVVEDTLKESQSFMSNLDDIGVTRDIRVAIVISKNKWQHIFSETAATIQGFIGIRYFDSIPEAETWLNCKI